MQPTLHEPPLRGFASLSRIIHDTPKPADEIQRWERGIETSVVGYPRTSQVESIPLGLIVDHRDQRGRR